MTGVGGRPEVIIEGSSNPDTGAWKVVKHQIVCFFLYQICVNAGVRLPVQTW